MEKCAQASNGRWSQHLPPGSPGHGQPLGDQLWKGVTVSLTWFCSACAVLERTVMEKEGAVSLVWLPKCSDPTVASHRRRGIRFPNLALFISYS